MAKEVIIRVRGADGAGGWKMKMRGGQGVGQAGDQRRRAGERGNEGCRKRAEGQEGGLKLTNGLTSIRISRKGRQVND